MRLLPPGGPALSNAVALHVGRAPQDDADLYDEDLLRVVHKSKPLAVADLEGLGALRARAGPPLPRAAAGRVIR
ncbi:hypothetical protein [Comamonas sediminis]|uniref:Uncharacterized protein n=1 Tax=Comamonas sediminis TaxID=1783360 RepID=A0ABV4AYQ3_9BURK